MASKTRNQPAGTRAGASQPQQASLDPSTLPQARSAAPFAVTTDGAVFINIGELGQVDPEKLAGRTLFVGAELTSPERRGVRERLKDAGDELCAKVAGALRPRRKSMARPE